MSQAFRRERPAVPCWMSPEGRHVSSAVPIRSPADTQFGLARITSRARAPRSVTGPLKDRRTLNRLPAPAGARVPQFLNLLGFQQIDEFMQVAVIMQRSHIRSVQLPGPVKPDSARQRSRRSLLLACRTDAELA